MRPIECLRFRVRRLAVRRGRGDLVLDRPSPLRVHNLSLGPARARVPRAPGAPTGPPASGRRIRKPPSSGLRIRSVEGRSRGWVAEARISSPSPRVEGPMGVPVQSVRSAEPHAMISAACSLPRSSQGLGGRLRIHVRRRRLPRTQRDPGSLVRLSCCELMNLCTRAWPV